MMPKGRGRRIGLLWQDQVLKTASYLISLVWLVLLLFPLFWLVSTSVKDKELVTANPPAWLPRAMLHVTVQLDYSRLAQPASPSQLKEMVRCDLAAAVLIPFDRFNMYGLNRVTAQAYQDGRRIGEATTNANSLRFKSLVLPATTITMDYMRHNDNYRLFYSGIDPKPIARFDITGGLGGMLSPGDVHEKRIQEITTWLQGEHFYGRLLAVGNRNNWARGILDAWVGPFLMRFFGMYPPFHVFIRNSFIVTTLEILLTLLVCSMAAYALSRLFVRTAQRIWLLYFLVSLMIPMIAVLVPGLFLAKSLHIYDTLWGIILFSIPNGFIIYILKGFIDALPGELFDAARIDGASEYAAYLRLVLPLCKPVLAVAVMILFLGSWNNFFWPYVIISSPTKFTFPVGLYFFTTNGITGTSNSFTYGLAASIPTILIFAFFQNQIQKGLVWSGIKG